jgi:hypothetical protein
MEKIIIQYDSGEHDECDTLDEAKARILAARADGDTVSSIVAEDEQGNPLKWYECEWSLTINEAKETELNQHEVDAMKHIIAAFVAAGF